MAEFTVVTFNLHAGMRAHGPLTERLWSWRTGSAPSANGTYDVVGVLEKLDPDVAVLQESWSPDVGPSAVHTLAAGWNATVHEVAFGRGQAEPFPRISYRLGPATGSLGIAVVSRLPSRQIATLPVGHVPADPAADRRALHIELDVRGSAIDLVGVHLTSRLPYGPPAQLRRLRHRLPPPGRPAVVLGDFNLWGPAVSRLLPGWRRAVHGPTWPAHRPHSQIDHVLLRGDIEVVAGEILPGVGSDHRPLRITLRTGRPASVTRDRA